MLTADTRIDTDRAGRYLTQLCRHAAAMGGGHASHPHHPRTHPDIRIRAEWSSGEGSITFAPWGRCALTADDSALTVHIEAADTSGLRRIEDIITNNLDRFSHRNPLRVNWTRSQSPDSATLAATRDENAAEHAGQHARLSRPRTVLIATVVIGILAAHLLLGGSLVRDIGALSVIGAAVILCKLAFMGLVGRNLHRRLIAKAGSSPH
ncbi:DUF2218 domain-containing protein [Nocardia nepalensis]|uniref:DUF2218 domain-containing protein n=1 Tax=Nocardia nepalensis TaxID=3375448 RepID=UPI003B685831